MLVNLLWLGILHENSLQIPAHFWQQKPSILKIIMTTDTDNTNECGYWIVKGRVHLCGKNSPDKCQGVIYHTMHLRNTSESVCILNSVPVLVIS